MKLTITTLVIIEDTTDLSVPEISICVPGPLPGTTEGFCEEMNVVYRTEELNTYLRYPRQEINPWDKHSTYIRLKLREILKVNLTDITIIDIISLP